MHLVNSIGKFYFNTRLPSIDRFIAQPIESQNKVFSYLLRRASGTEFGRKHGFADIRNYEEFKAAIPLQDYEAAQPMTQVNSFL